MTEGNQDNLSQNDWYRESNPGPPDSKASTLQTALPVGFKDN